MTSRLSHPLLHIEMATQDLEGAYQVLHGLLKAEKIEEDFARLIDSPFMRIIHIGLGEVVLQFCHPQVEEMPLMPVLREKGVCVHNLTYFVEDIGETVRRLEQEGILTLLETPMNLIQWQEVMDPANIREDQSNLYIMGSMDKIGFNLELAEQPWKNEPEKPFMFPAYTLPRPKTDERVSKLLYARVMVPDAEETCALLRRVFMLDDMRERYNKTEDGPFTKIIDIKLGSVVLRFCQPRADGNDWDKYLKERGPGVTGLAFSVNELAETLKIIGNAEIPGLSAIPLDWDPLIGTEDTPDQMQMVYTINTAQKIGFDLELWA